MTTQERLELLYLEASKERGRLSSAAKPGIIFLLMNHVTFDRLDSTQEDRPTKNSPITYMISPKWPSHGMNANFKLPPSLPPYVDGNKYVSLNKVKSALSFPIEINNLITTGTAKIAFWNGTEYTRI